MRTSPAAHIVVTGLGMVSALGHDVVTSCAAARAGITRPAELSVRIFEERTAEVVPVYGYPVSGLTEGFSGIGRMVRLGTAALADLTAYAGIQRAKGLRVGLFVNLADQYMQDVDVTRKNGDQRSAQRETGSSLGRSKEVHEELREQFVSLIDRHSVLSFLGGKSVYFQGHHGVATAVHDAMHMLQERTVDLSIVGGIDSYVDAEYASVVERLGLLKTSENPTGFIPGEAAAFVALERRDDAVRRGACVEAQIEAVGHAEEPIHRFHEQASTGIALAGAIEKSLMTQAGKEATDLWVLADLNGDPWRSDELGHALVRLSPHLQGRTFTPWYPAASFGETGAAAGAVALCLGIRAFVRGYTSADRMLIALSSYSGSKGSLSVRRANVPELQEPVPRYVSAAGHR